MVKLITKTIEMITEATCHDFNKFFLSWLRNLLEDSIETAKVTGFLESWTLGIVLQTVELDSESSEIDTCVIV